MNIHEGKHYDNDFMHMNKYQNHMSWPKKNLYKFFDK